MERTASAHRQGAVDIAMISLMRGVRGLEGERRRRWPGGMSSGCKAGQAACVTGALARTTTAY